jgi:arsenate reductase (thioredoxin)
MSQDRPFKILFLCTGNSARSVFGEYFIHKLGKGKFESHSAGADPRSEVNPYALRVLKEAYKIDASNARPKSWDLYEGLK